MNRKTMSNVYYNKNRRAYLHITHEICISKIANKVQMANFFKETKDLKGAKEHAESESDKFLKRKEIHISNAESVINNQGFNVFTASENILTKIENIGRLQEKLKSIISNKVFNYIELEFEKYQNCSEPLTEIHKHLQEIKRELLECYDIASSRD